MTSRSPRFLPETVATWHGDAEVVVVGTGAAGLSAALSAASGGRRVLLLTKGELTSGSTPLAQGGLAVVTDPLDSFVAHANDTLVAAAGLADEGRVNELVRAAPSVVEELSQRGATFDAGGLGLEGGHSRRRIVHAGGDAIGAELHRVLRSGIKNSSVEIMEHTVAIDVAVDEGRVVGLKVGRVDASGRLEVGLIATTAIVLATGGYGQAFATSTNPSDVTGDGLALAARAGAELANVEFVQFHPTVLYSAGHKGQSPLITEALRGAGGVIVDGDARPVMSGVHPLADLAPRDVVAYAMVQHMLASGPRTNLWLDARGIGATRLEKEFPTTTSLCRAFGIEPAKEPIPIAPGAHYACGGVRADLDGATSIPGLYAVGEVAATGVHGANRLASNSLTEAVIAGRRVGIRLAQQPSSRETSMQLTDVPHGRGVDASSREALAAEMSLHAGVVRERAGLEHVRGELDATPPSSATALDLATLEATNLHTTSLLLVAAATVREESRGCHRRSDFEQTDPTWAHPSMARVVDGEIVLSTAMALA